MAATKSSAEAALAQLGQTHITLEGVIAGALIVAAFWAASWVASRLLRRLRLRAGKAAPNLYVLEKIVGYGLIVVGLFVGLQATGLNLSSLALFAGALGVGLGLGLQGVVKEFFSGLFLIFDRMLAIGDYIEIKDGVRGVVQEIGPRATRIRTNDNVNILVPNSHLIEDRVINWTLKGDTRRIHIPFSVAYGADRNKVRDAVLACARASPFTLPDTDARKSQVWLVGFGESGMQFELLVWPTPEAVKRPAAMHAAYTWTIADALDGAGIEVPFPQTDLRIRSVFGREGDAALQALGLDAGARKTEAAPVTSAPAPSANDAEQDLLAHPESAAEEPEPPDEEGAGRTPLDTPPPSSARH